MESSSSTTDAQMKREIEMLTATINQHKQLNKPKTYGSGGYQDHPATNTYSYHAGRSNAYVNPNYKPPNKYIRPGLNPSPGALAVGTAFPAPAPFHPTTQSASSSNASPSSTSAGGIPLRSNAVAQTKEVVLNGVAFESSGRSLVRKDLPKSTKPVTVGKSSLPITRPHGRPSHPYHRKPGHIPPSRTFKLKSRRGRGRNMTLNNTRSSSSRRGGNKRLKQYSDKPCPRFTTTGACSRGLTCLYQHDPLKIAICWNFLQDNCPNTAETCNLSHDPTPERTPLCLHFLNKGRCTREKCPFPHVNVRQREGVCRDFAVLGYCEKGLECDKQHVRECPDFAEKGTCGTKGCKLPHVIRANRSRKAAAAVPKSTTAGISPTDEEKVDSSAILRAENAQLGDEYISLTFQESDSSEEEEEEESLSGSGDEEMMEDGDLSEDEPGMLEVNM